ncbi:MAG: helix-turn-helix transcriptional regulator [Candidatus Komeilibacteria bacterium]
MKKPIQFVSSQVLHKKWMKDPKFRRAYEELEPEYALLKKMIQLRIAKGLTQKQLAKKLGTKQSAISRLENGNLNPTLKSFYKLARALDAKVKITVK